MDFVGEVLSSRIVIDDGGLASYLFGVRHNLYQIRVIESFRGSQHVGDVIDVQTGLGGGDCGYHFEIGQRYLVDAGNRGGVLQTGICSLTAPFDRSDAELRVLRKMAAHQPLPSLVGNLTHKNGPPDWQLVGPLPSITVKLESTNGGQPRVENTDRSGSFSFSNVPTGKYQIFLSLPANLSPAITDFGKIDSERLPPITIENIVGAACHADVVVEPSGRISGVVRSPAGTIEGWVNADTVRPDGSPWNTVESATPDSDGKFSLEHLTPGRYRIQFTGRQGFVQGIPQIIDVADGERKTGIILVTK